MQHLSIEAVTELLQVHRMTVLGWIDKGELTAIKLGDARNSAVRVSEESLRAFIERRKVQPKMKHAASPEPAAKAAG